MDEETLKRVYERIERVDKVIDEIREDMKDHCKDADIRMRKYETESIKQEVLLESFMSIQKEQTEMTKTLIQTMNKFDKTITTMQHSFEDLYTKSDKNACDISNVNKKVSENEDKNKIDLRDVNKKEQTTALERAKPWLYVTGVLTAISGVALGFLKVLEAISAIAVK